MLKRLLLLGLLITASVVAQADTITTGGARVLENPTSGGDLKFRINVGGTKFDALSLFGASGNVSVGNGFFLTNYSDSVTNVATTSVATFTRESTGTVATGFGARHQYDLENATGVDRAAAYLGWEWANAGNGTESSKLSLWTRDAGAALSKAAEFAVTSTDSYMSLFEGATERWRVRATGADNGMQLQYAPDSSTPLTISPAGITTLTGLKLPTTGGTPATLNYYEEGSFTPVVASTGTAGTVTYLNQFGTFTRVGRMVYAHASVQWNNWTGSPTGSLRVQSFPFGVSSSNHNPNCMVNGESIVYPSTVNGAAIFAQFGTAAQYVNILINRDNAGSQNVLASSNAGAVTRSLWVTCVYSIN